MRTVTILGIESSCDETASAVVQVDVQEDKGIVSRKVLSDIVYGQESLHEKYGGVVPEIAARAHAERLDICVEKAMNQADLEFDAIDAVAVTAGPGLIGGLIVGLATAKSIALAANKPLIGINHLEGHALTVRLLGDVGFPYLVLLISGGHCQLLIALGVGSFTRLGTTLDDSPGEAFDKVGHLLNLGYPGGARVEARAAQGNPDRFVFPRPLSGNNAPRKNKAQCNFSFSGLKTAVKYKVLQLTKNNECPLEIEDVADLCAGFQAAVRDVLVERSRTAMRIFRKQFPNCSQSAFCICGGVAANQVLRTALQNLCKAEDFHFIAPTPNLCTDNAVMIAWAGIEHYLLQFWDKSMSIEDQKNMMAISPRSRWPLDLDGLCGSENGK
jgi:N6-L-threonylcarbamoyladenine synthase